MIKVNRIMMIWMPKVRMVLLKPIQNRMFKRDSFEFLIEDLRALGKMAVAGRAQAHRIAKLLRLENKAHYRGHGPPSNPPMPDNMHIGVAELLADMGPFETDDAVFTVLKSKDGHPSGLAMRRFLTHFLSGGKL